MLVVTFTVTCTPAAVAAGPGPGQYPERCHIPLERQYPFNIVVPVVGFTYTPIFGYVTYDCSLPDSDETDATGTYTTDVSLTLSGPGTNAGVTLTYNIVDIPSEQTCKTVTQRLSFPSGGLFGSGLSKVYRIVGDNSLLDADMCGATFSLQVTSSGGASQQLDFIPIVLYNDDAQPQGPLEVAEVTNATAAKALAAARVAGGAATAAFLLWIAGAAAIHTIRNDAIRMTADLILLGLLGLPITNEDKFFVVAATTILFVIDAFRFGFNPRRSINT